MNKRQKKKDARKVMTWLIIEESDGFYNSLGVNRLGLVGNEAHKPFDSTSATIEDVVELFDAQSDRLRFVKVTEEEERFLLGFDEKKKFGEHGERYLLAKSIPVRKEKDYIYDVEGRRIGRTKEAYRQAWSRQEGAC